MISKRVNSLKYAIREIAVKISEIEKQGNIVTKLNIGDPLKYDFKTPEVFARGVADNVDKGFYGPSEGIPELRNAVSHWEKNKGVQIDPKNVYINNGVSEAILALFATIIDEGDEVVLPSPTFPPYSSFAKFFGAKIKFYDAINPDPNEINELVTNKTKAFVLINPNNPTGQVYSKEFLSAVADLKTLVVADEIYDLLRFDGKVENMGRIRDENLLVFNGFSKTFLAPGYRLGYSYFKGAEEVEKGFLKFLMARLSSIVPIQYGAVEAINDGGTWIKPLIEKLRIRRDTAYSGLKNAGFKVVKPESAFYIFPEVEDDVNFAMDLLEKKHVAVVHGTGFSRPNHFRMVFLPPKDVLTNALEKIEAFSKTR
ncbi:MAG: aminotransferase class I/II-fold pyridoxal phosphate-dependent enzyme [Candidatus Altiarchaeota archaeon]|nr:aminotransferase class I/II-fold pyridoxal phosphate-dependent enzyme [Candidatus Altiarchaeota archaeon]